MSNTASQPLCQELYELLEWKGTDFVYASHVNTPIYRSGGHLKSGIVPDYPAYTLGYLMRKLPTYFEWAGENVYLSLSPGTTAEWFCSYAMLHGNVPAGNAQFGRYNFDKDADTPEDACAKLAIELAKAGILKRSES